MNKAKAIGIAAGFLLLILFFWRDNTRLKMPIQAAEPLEGTLYRGDIEEITKADRPLPAPPLAFTKLEPDPPVAVSQRNLARLGFKVSTGPYVVNVLSGTEAPYELVRGGREKSRKSDITPEMTNVLVSSVPLSQVGGEPISKVHDFKFFDVLIETNESACLLHGRYQKGDVRLELEKLLKWHDFYLLKLSITNEGEREFFIKGAKILANGVPIRINEYLPFSCMPGETEEGIVKFSILDATGKALAIQLMENRRKGTLLEIKHVEYPF